MALVLKRVSWKVFLPGCVKPKRTCSVPRYNVSAQRITLPDVSNPGSTVSLNDLSSSLPGSNLHIFKLKELEMMTNNFSRGECLGEGGFGKVYKGFIDDKFKSGLEAQPVAIKVLDQHGGQGHREWLAEVVLLGQLKHPHLVNLIGYCCENEHRILVYEYMALGNLGNKLFENYSITLPWLKRIKIALGAAKCLAFLHEQENPVIHRDLKASNILLDTDYNAKLSDFGLAMVGPQGDDTISTNCKMGTEGYAAPEYIKSGKLTTMCDVFGFGVVLLELLTGRRSVDKKRPRKEWYLVEWARPFLNDFRKLEQIMDPRLEGQYSTEGVRRAAKLAYRCLSPQPKRRPTMSTVVKTLEPLLHLKDIPIGTFECIISAEGTF